MTRINFPICDRYSLRATLQAKTAVQGAVGFDRSAACISRPASLRFVPFPYGAIDEVLIIPFRPGGGSRILGRTHLYRRRI
jgi:hypothetical protein